MTLPTTPPELIEFLRTTALFGSLDASLLHQLADGLEPVTCAPGEVLMRMGDPGDSLYLIRRGRLNFFTPDAAGGEARLDQLEAGEAVGAMSLLTGEARTATVVADTPAELVRLSGERFRQLLQQYPETREGVTRAIFQRVQLHQLNAALRDNRLLSGLGEPVLSDLKAELELVVVPSGGVLVREGEESDALYLLLSGRLRVVTQDMGGSKRTLVEIERGQTVGEIGLVTREHRTASVIAIRDSVLARLPRAGFARLLARHPDAILHHFAGTVIDRLIGQVKGTLRPEGGAVTFAVLPGSMGVDPTLFAERLARALAALGPTLHLNASAVDQRLGRAGAAQIPISDSRSPSLVRWLNDQEAQRRYVVYQADPTPSAWTERCLRQADRVLLFAEADSAPAPQPRPPGTHLTLVLQHPPGTALPRGTRRWLEALVPDHHYHHRQGDPGDLARLARLLAGFGVGLVLSGGGARGFAHIGALRALREAGIPVDLIGGTSMGGLMACQQAMGWDGETVMARNRQAIAHRFDYTLPITALMAGAEMTLVVKEMFGDTQMEDLWLPCFCVTANLSRGHEMVHTRGPVWKYARATTSIPGVLPPVMEKGEMLVDGGVFDNLPTGVMRQMAGAGPVFALDVSADRPPAVLENAPFESSLSGWQVLLNRLNPFRETWQVPTLMQIMMNLAVTGSAQALSVARNLADFYLPLSPGQYSMLDFKALDAIVENGYRSALAVIETWKSDDRFRRVQTG